MNRFFRYLRKWRHVFERTPPFLRVVFSSQGLPSPVGRKLIWGKFRRFIFSVVPPFAVYLQKKYGLSGGCVSCGASCKLLFRCPHWDDRSHLCTVYEDRPNICRLFPITPADIRDRNLVLAGKDCGFTFKKEK